MKPDDLKIGKVGKSAEHILGISFTFEPWIYIKGEELDAMAREHPGRYLEVLDMLGRIFRQPDFVAASPDGREVRFVKIYFQKNEFYPFEIRVKLGGRPQAFFLDGFGRRNEEETAWEYRRYHR